jgi:transglutaminase-like putative cysteine protease
MALGGPRTVSNDLVMDIYVPNEMPNLYWRAIAMDTYEDGSWSANDWETTLHFPDDGFLNVEQSAAREEITQTVVNYIPNSSFLYAAPEVIGSSRQMFVDSTVDDAGNELVSAVRSRFVLTLGDQYEVTSRISTADVESLQQASTAYPIWVTDTYLQLSDELTPETLALAEQLTAGFDNPYDKATAVQDYLRTNITYNDQIEAPPPNVEPIHYTLFESQEAYCTYYASAMAMMLRSQGIPTRIVNGYAQGAFDEETNSYRVRASNAHSWVEVYFPGYGWIQFEPTASIPVVVRQQRLGDNTAQFERDRPDLAELESLFDPEEESRFGDSPEAEVEPVIPTETWVDRLFTWQTAVALIILLIAILLIWTANQFNKRIEADVNRSYSRLETWAGWLGLHFQSANTPYERADLLLSEVPEGHAPVRNLTHQYVLSQFSPAHQNEDDFKPQDEWRILRPILLRKSIQRRLEQWRQPK